MKNGIAVEEKKYPSVDKRKLIKLRSFTNPKVRLCPSPTDTRR